MTWQGRAVYQWIKSATLKLFGRIACNPTESMMRRIIFDGEGILLKQWRFCRKRGRPRLQWSTAIHAIAENLMSESDMNLQDIIGAGLDVVLWTRGHCDIA